jgi:hypothetical protein
MKKLPIAVIFLGALQLSEQASAQSMAIAWDMYVFPAGDQSIEQQYEDERECLARSREITGVDPANPMAGVRVRS